MPKQKHKLTMKGLDELSLVDNPANQHAAMVIAKRMAKTPKMTDRLSALAKRFLDRVAPADLAEFQAVIKEAETYEEAMNRPEIWEKQSALSSTISSILDDDTLAVGEKRTRIDAALSSFRDDILSVTKAAAKCADCGEVMKDGACPKGHVAKLDTPNPPAPGAEDMKTPQTFTDLAAANAHIGVLTKQLGDTEEKLDAEVAKGDPDSIIVKGLPAAQAELIRKERQRDRDRIAKLEAANADAARVTKAATIFKGIASDDEPGRAATLAVIKVLDGVASDAERTVALEFVTKLAAQHAAVVKELDGYEVGGAGSNTSGGKADRAERLDKAAREIMKVEKGITYPQAISKALEQDATLYDETDDEDESDA